MNAPRHALNKSPLTWSMLLSTATGAMAWYVPKDFMAPGVARGTIRAVGLTAGFSLYIMDSTQRTSDDVQAAVSNTSNTSHTSNAEFTKVSRWKVLGLALAVLAVIVLGLCFSIWVERKMLAFLERKGVKYPNSLWGLISALAIAGSLWTDQDLDPHLPGGILAKR